MLIPKAITIYCEGVIGGVLVTGANGFVVAAGPNDVVIIRGLDINGLGTGLSGIEFNSGKQLIVEDTFI